MSTFFLAILAITNIFIAYFLYLVVRSKVKQLRIFHLFGKKKKADNVLEFWPDGHVKFDKKGNV